MQFPGKQVSWVVFVCPRVTSASRKRSSAINICTIKLKSTDFTEEVCSICKLIQCSWLDQQIIARCLLKRCPRGAFRQSVCAAPLESVLCHSMLTLQTYNGRAGDEVSPSAKLLTSFTSFSFPLISSCRRGFLCTSCSK